MTIVSHIFDIYNVIKDTINADHSFTFPTLSIKDIITNLLCFDKPINDTCRNKDVYEIYRNYIYSKERFKCIVVKRFELDSTFMLDRYNSFMCSLPLSVNNMLLLITFNTHLTEMKYKYNYVYKEMKYAHVKNYKEHIQTFTSIIVEISNDIDKTQTFNEELCNKLIEEYETIYALCNAFKVQINEYVKEYDRDNEALTKIKTRLDEVALSISIDAKA